MPKLVLQLLIAMEQQVQTRRAVDALDKCLDGDGFLAQEQIFLVAHRKEAEKNGKGDGGAEEADQFHVDGLVRCKFNYLFS